MSEVKGNFLGFTQPERYYKQSEIQPLIDAAKDFINKVYIGKARSTDSYNKFKEALEKL